MVEQPRILFYSFLFQMLAVTARYHYICFPSIHFIVGFSSLDFSLFP